MKGPICANCGGEGCPLCAPDRRSPPTLEQLLEDLRRNTSHSTAEWLELRLHMLLRAVAAEHPEVRLLVPGITRIEVEIESTGHWVHPLAGREGWNADLSGPSALADVELGPAVLELRRASR